MTAHIGRAATRPPGLGDIEAWRSLWRPAIRDIRLGHGTWRCTAPRSILIVLVILLAAACGALPNQPATPSPLGQTGEKVILPTLVRTSPSMASATPVPPTGTATPPPSPTATPVSDTPTARPATQTPTPLPTSVPASKTPSPMPPTPTRTPTAPPPTSTPLPPAVSLRQGSVVVAAYPYDQYVTMVMTPTYTMSYPRLDWQAYEAASPRPTPRTFSAIIMENEYLRVTVLPDLGGRIYQAIFKPTGHNIFYQNPVLKPTHWGNETQGWWLAAGGMEWCLPVDEHGYEWGMPWGYRTAQSSDQVSVTVWDTQEGGRIQARVTISLDAGRSYFTVSPRIENAGGQAVRYQFWLNAMLASGGTNHVGEATEFILPTDQVTIHSTGDRSLPQAGQAMSWPRYHDRVMSLYGTWRAFLGVFARPRAMAGFMGAYDHAGGEGVLRIFPPDVAPGAKLFGAKGLDESQWTDDGSAYFELHGGVTPTFWDYTTLAPGGVITWSERWYPYLAIGPVEAANDQAALSLDAVQGGYRLGVAVTRPLSGRVILEAGGREIWSQAVSLTPAQPFVQTVSTNAGSVALRLVDEQGRVVIGQ